MWTDLTFSERSLSDYLSETVTMHVGMIQRRLLVLLAAIDLPRKEKGSNPITDMLASPAAKAVLAGIAAMVVKRVMQGSSRTA